MKKNEALPGKFLNAADAEEEDLVLTITDVRMEKMGDGKEKPCAFFKEKKITEGKGMVINSTNWDILEGMFGADSDDWVGQQITVTTEMVNSPNGGRVPGLRVVEVRKSKAGTKVNAAPAARSGKQRPEPSAEEQDDDENEPPY